MRVRNNERPWNSSCYNPSKCRSNVNYPCISWLNANTLGVVPGLGPEDVWFKWGRSSALMFLINHLWGALEKDTQYLWLLWSLSLASEKKDKVEWRSLQWLNKWGHIVENKGTAASQDNKKSVNEWCVWFSVECFSLSFKIKKMVSCQPPSIHTCVFFLS